MPIVFSEVGVCIIVVLYCIVVKKVLPLRPDMGRALP